VPHQGSPDHRVIALSEDRLRRHIDEDRAEQGKRDADAAEDEILPGRLQRFRSAIDADHQHRRQGGELDRHPHQANIVGEQRQIHGEHHRLIHGVIEPHMRRLQFSHLDFVTDIARAVGARREPNEGREHDENNV